MVCVNLSQTWALYCLILFYHELSSLMQPLNPFAKFVSVKFVIFLSFWQAVVISILVEAGAIKETLEYNVDDVAKGLQDFLICIEMALAAIIHRRAFSYRDFSMHGPLLEHMKEHGGQKIDARTAMVEMLPMEVIAEATAYGNDTIQNFMPGRKKADSSETARTILPEAGEEAGLPAQPGDRDDAGPVEAVPPGEGQDLKEEEAYGVVIAHH
mmetsp:Transcript_54821/g.134086  ORF Transcript_54821/g.134086 Transcript_54821/m.134086 type:complete len:212 (-) Transcript_54821:2004-2639(-)